MKKKIVLFLVFIFSLQFLLCACSTSPNGGNGQGNVYDENGNILNSGTVYDMPSKLQFSSTTVNSTIANDGINIQATIKPDNAVNKTVDWDIAFSNQNQWSADKVISDYLVISTASDGSNIVNIKCLAIFNDDVILTVTTRDGGFKARCIITFVGLPETITVDLTTLNIEDNKYLMSTNRSYSFDISLANRYNSVGSQFSKFTVNVEGKGSVVLGTADTFSGVLKWSEVETIKNIDDLKSKLIECTIVGNVLKVSVKSHIESYCRDSEYEMGGYYYYDLFKRYNNTEDKKSVYFTITVMENQTKISTVFNVYVYTGVSNVELKPTERF